MNHNFNYEDFIIMLGDWIFKALLLVIVFITYASRRNFILEEILSNKSYELGFIEGIGLTLVIFAQISRSSVLLYNIYNAIVIKISQSTNSHAQEGPEKITDTQRNKSITIEERDIILARTREIVKNEITQNKGANFPKSIGNLSLETYIWLILWKRGGAQRFTDILRIAKCSRSQLSKVLRKLLRSGLIRMVGARYQAISINPSQTHE